MITKNSQALEDLCKALLNLHSQQEALNFLQDLCTPQEIRSLAERWRVCQLLHQGGLSYRDIRQMTGASLTTIGRVARFLHHEPYQGYKSILQKIKGTSKI